MTQDMCSEEESPGSEIEDNGETENVCIICKKSRVTVNKKTVSLVTSSDQALLGQLEEAAEFVGDEETRLNTLCYRDQKSFTYHKRCKSSILYRKEQMQREFQQKDKDWHKIRLFNKNAFEEICAFVKEKVVKNKMFCYLESLRKLYNDSIATQIHESNATLNFTDIESNKLELKLMKELNGDIEIGQALDKIDLLQRTAITLREEIFSIPKRELPDALNATEIARGECSIPDSLQIFYETLLGGANLRRRFVEKCKRLSSSFAQDAIFGVTNGKVKPAKHLQLGIALKSLTSSRKIIDIMNLYGHSCSYNVVEEIETEAVISSLETTQVCPEDIIKSPYLCTGLAFDNFGRFVDSLTGKETLHDTVGIIYQDILEISSQNKRDEYSTPSAERDCSKRRKRRRTCDPVTPELEE
ncbi:unnamed protein product [Brassicogethes aeneus]|uniref:Uncharacterized protein n=1 Tax=Brassicogethes aeneus TaxID=1431903 RepID=A0A9P0FNI5_BRAAE|nr:unnamed protein product [Brassicogethes aeneus]